MANFIDGRERANQILDEVRRDVQTLGHSPRLAIFLASDDPASKVFVNIKMKKAKEVGIDAKLYKFPEDTSKEEFTHELNRLRHNVGVNGALLQLPLYESLKPYTNDFLNAIVPEKDADGLTALNQGSSSYLLPGSIPPATVEAVLECLDIVKEENFTWSAITEGSFKIKSLIGQFIVIINNSNLIGKPLAQILSSLGGTVVIANETTQNLSELTTKADIIVSATGKTNIIDHNMIKEGAILIDVTSEKIDVEYSGDFVRSFELDQKASWITPVPGGVGPLTVACLLRNVVRLSAVRYY